MSKLHVMPIAAAILLAACTDQPDNNGQNTAVGDSASCPANTTGVTVPAGFCINVFADTLGKARHIAVAPNGDVFVALEATDPSPEKKIAMGL